ncbi:MAG: 7-cyano-7-deazaguanine synthase [Phycisphaerales bacterium]|nr:7-cyano-7-deazaguanine synthase [Phycisphaerales bacterium]
MAKAVAIVLSSGGLHSLVTAALAAREYRIAMLHVQDGRSAARQAAAAFDKQAAHFKPMKAWNIDGTFLRQMSLPPESAGVVHATSSDPQAALLATRELQYLTLAAGHARQIRASTIFWGVQIEQKQADAIARNIEFVQLFNQILELISIDGPLSIKTPLIGLDDQQVVELGYQMGVPFAASWTCQMSLEHPCMSCPACTRRARSFRAAQLADPLTIKEKQSMGARR